MERSDLGDGEVGTVHRRLVDFPRHSDADVLSGADYSKGWSGVCVDGAIETGITAARRVLRELA